MLCYLLDMAARVAKSIGRLKIGMFQSMYNQVVRVRLRNTLSWLCAVGVQSGDHMATCNSQETTTIIVGLPPTPFTPLSNGSICSFM